MELILLITSIILAETTYIAYRFTARKPPARIAQGIICDTSALIDGRILSIARSGFISATFIIPRSVIREMQWMADKADHDKRERARFGLDVVQQLQALKNISVEVFDDGEIHKDGVDEQLIVLAKRFEAKLCTTDYNLNKVARVEGITVVNVNELAHSLRPMHLPGEKVQVMIVSLGQNKDQGVGYLDDGTMVVVDGGKKHLNKVIEVETVRILQTEAGRMMFGKTSSSNQSTRTTHHSSSQTLRHAKKKPYSKPTSNKLTGEEKLIATINNTQ